MGLFDRYQSFIIPVSSTTLTADEITEQFGKNSKNRKI